MRRGVAIILMTVVVVSSMATQLPNRPLPACCKAHGCTMMKRVTSGCALARCDQNETARDVNPALAVLTTRSIGAGQVVSPLQSAPVIVAARIISRRIDHPPQLLPV